MSINNGINTVVSAVFVRKKRKRSTKALEIFAYSQYYRTIDHFRDWNASERTHVRAFERFQRLVEWNSYHRSEEKSPVSLSTPLSGSLRKNRLIAYQWRSNSCLRHDWMMRENWDKKSRNGEREKEDLPKPRAQVSKWCLSLFSPSNGCIISRRLFFLRNMQGAIDRLSEWPVVTPITLRISLWDPCDNDKWINLRCNADNFAITRKLIESPRSTICGISSVTSHTGLSNRIASGSSSRSISLRLTPR